MKRFIVIMSLVVVLLLGLGTAAFFGLGFYLSPQSPLTKSDVIVAISGGDTAARTAEAVQLYRAGWAPHIIFSGAALDPTSPSNAKVMAETAEADGVPSAAITLEESSATTLQNAEDVAKIVSNDDYHQIILVTSPYHQRRASILFNRALGDGVKVLNHSSYDQNWRRSDWWANASSRSITISELQKTIYELVAGSK